MKHALLSCTGLDKPEGSAAREIAIRAAEIAGTEIVCPVLLNRAPVRYKKILDEDNLIVIDGCATRCATRLAEKMGATVDIRVLVADEAKASAQSIEQTLRLGPNGMALVQSVVNRLIERLNRPSALAEPAAVWETPAEFLTVTYDKFEFRIPAKDYLFNENDCWVRVNDGIARIGLSDYLQQRLTDIGFFEPAETGSRIEQFGELGSVESAKAVFEIISPVTGTLISANPDVMEKPELVNADPYGAGWLVEMRLDNLEQDKEFLLGGPAYAEAVRRKAAES